MTESTSTPPRPDWWPQNPHVVEPDRAWVTTAHIAYEEALRDCWAAMCDWLNVSNDPDFWRWKARVEDHRYGEAKEGNKA